MESNELQIERLMDSNRDNSDNVATRPRAGQVVFQQGLDFSLRGRVQTDCG